VQRLNNGISVNSTRNQARRKARQHPTLGNYVAELRIPAGAAVHYERTTASEGHHTLWGDPGLLLSLVVSVERV